jgi:hypothetical protein
LATTKHARAFRLFAATLALFLAGAPAHAQAKLEASYVATLAGVPIGKAAWLLDLTPEKFVASASGRTTGLLQVLAGGRGSLLAQGSMTGAKLTPGTYEITNATDKKTNVVKMAIANGSVKEFSAEPPSPPYPDRVAITENHRRGVLDPVSAALMTAAGTGEVLAPETCNRTLPVFDGRGRFDLVLSFKRMDKVKAVKGYQGPALVCAVSYRPISGHRATQSAVRYLTEATEIEVWLAPLQGTRVLVPFRASVPTVFGPAVVEATQFVTVAQTARSSPATPKTQ